MGIRYTIWFLQRGASQDDLRSECRSRYQTKAIGSTWKGIEGLYVRAGVQGTPYEYAAIAQLVMAVSFFANTRIICILFSAGDWIIDIAAPPLLVSGSLGRA